MSTKISAPYPNKAVTMVLPSAKYDDSRTPEGKVISKTTMLGGHITYVNSSDRETLVMKFLLSRQKSLEVTEFFRIYYRAKLELTMFDGSVWVGNLVGPIAMVPVSRRTSSDEAVETTMTFSVVKQ